MNLLLVLSPATLNLSAGMQAAPDTVVTLAARDGYDLLMAVAAGIFALTFLVLLAAFLFVLLQIHRGVRSVGEIRDRVSADPAVASVRKISANVEAISDTVRGEAEELSRSVRRLSERLRQASDRMEERIEDFNALMEVLQEEAEDTFVDTASTARGVRRGIGRLQDGKARRGRRRTPPVRDAPDSDSGSEAGPTPEALPAGDSIDDTEVER
jgi:methyl-accepting chemotaxis protein